MSYIDICEAVAQRKMTLDEATYILERRARREQILDRLAVCVIGMTALALTALVLGQIV